MKKIIALALGLMMILCAAGALADETADTVELETVSVGQAFSIRSKLPEGYTFTLITSTDLNLVGLLAGGEDQPLITVSIAYNEAYNDVERFNDVDEETVQEIRDSFLAMDDVEFEDLETAYGTRLLKVTTSDKSFADIYTIYKGCELEFVIIGNGELQDADVQMLVDFISDMEFVPVE